MLAETNGSVDAITDVRFKEMHGVLDRAEEFSATFRQEIAALEAMRDETVAEVQREAEEIRDDATQHAETVLAEANERARRAIERAHATATYIIGSAENKHRHLEEVRNGFREALQHALDLVDQLPEASSEPSTVETPTEGPMASAEMPVDETPRHDYF